MLIVCGLLAAGCGGEEPALPGVLGAQLAAHSESTADGLDARRFCDAHADAAELQGRTIAAINAGQVPAELQEELLSFVNALLEAISCAPPRAEDGAAEDARELADWVRERSRPAPAGRAALPSRR